MRVHSVFILLLLAGGRLYSQNTNSPYSILGIGDIETNYYNRTAGMANTGFAYRDDKFLINNNPASYTAMPLHFFAFEISARGQFVNYYGTPLNGSSASGKDFAIKRLSVATKVYNWWATSGGLMPYSTANYSFSATKNIQGTNLSIPVQYDGTGGVNQVYWTNAFQPIKHLSLGVTASYLFGSLTQTEDLTTQGLNTTLATTQQQFLKNFHFNFGLQYYTPINKNWDIGIGGVYSPKGDLASDGTVTVTDNATQISTTSDDTKGGNFRLPYSSGVGFSITKGKKYTLVADYKYQAWTATSYSNLNYSLKNSSRTSVGFEISNKKTYFNNVFEKNFVHAGLFYGTSYLDINGHQLDEKGLTLGYGVNSKKNFLGLAVAMEVGQRGTQQFGLIKENYVNFTFTVSYRDFWRPRGVKYP